MRNLLTIFAIFFGLIANAQAKHNYLSGRCKLAGQLRAESGYCPGCAEDDKKNREAKIAEDKRVQAIAVQKAEAQRHKAIEENKRQNEKIAEEIKKQKENELHLGFPGNKVEKQNVKKEDLKETGVWIPKFAGRGLGSGFVDKSFQYVDETQLTDDDWKIKPNNNWSSTYMRDFTGNYTAIVLNGYHDISSPCGGTEIRNAHRSIIIDRNGHTVMESDPGDGFIMIGDSPFVLKMIGGWSAMDDNDACNASIYLIAQNKEILKLPHNSFGNEDYLKQSAFSTIGIAYIDAKGNISNSEFKIKPEFVQEIRSEIANANAIGCFIYSQGFEKGNNGHTVVLLKNDGTYKEIWNNIDYYRIHSR